MINASQHLQVDRFRSDANTIMKDKAQEILNIIEKKLNGQMGKTAHAKLPVSTEGQVTDTKPKVGTV